MDIRGDVDVATVRIHSGGVVSQTPSLPGSLYRMATPDGLLIVVTLRGGDRACLGWIERAIVSADAEVTLSSGWKRMVAWAYSN